MVPREDAHLHTFTLQYSWFVWFGALRNQGHRSEGQQYSQENVRAWNIPKRF